MWRLQQKQVQLSETAEAPSMNFFQEDLPIPSGTGTAPSSAPPMHQERETTNQESQNWNHVPWNEHWKAFENLWALHDFPRLSSVMAHGHPKKDHGPWFSSRGSAALHWHRAWIRWRAWNKKWSWAAGGSGSLVNVNGSHSFGCQKTSVNGQLGYFMVHDDMGIFKMNEKNWNLRQFPTGHDPRLVFCCPALPVVLSVGRISNTLGIPYAFCAQIAIWECHKS